MEVLAVQGALLVIGIGILLILLVVGLFVGNIVLFDRIVLAIEAGVCCNQFLSVHPAFCLLIAIAAFAGLLVLQRTRAGFWIIGGLLSAARAFVFGFIAYLISEGDMIWFYVILGLGFVVVGGTSSPGERQGIGGGCRDSFRRGMFATALREETGCEERICRQCAAE